MKAAPIAQKLTALTIVLAMALQSGCAHGVRLISIPEGADVEVDGKKVGKAPLLYRETTAFFGTQRTLKATLAGGTPIVLKETTHFCVSAANIILDVLLVGLAFATCLDDEYVFDFTRPQAPAPPTQQPTSAPKKVEGDQLKKGK